MALENHADGMDKKAASATIELERLARMAGILRNYRYEMDRPKSEAMGFAWADTDGQMREILKQFGK